MLFHSEEFLLIFLPLVLAAWYAAGARPRLRMHLLIVASFLFYGWWDVRLVPLLAGSILVNWALARGSGYVPPRRLVVVGIVLNLAVLGVFKYFNFFAESLALVAGADYQPWSIVLPLGISFFTFQQISYLADLSRDRAPLYRLDEYALYISFFPQLIAGPIVRHNELIFQFAEAPRRPGLHERLARGAILLVIGLAKKVFLADGLARVADPVFSAAAAGGSPTFAEAWAATFAFTFQIYFDFSAYSDMAIGLALMFGFTLPFNFDAPLRATSIREFWRRWHMTLTRFLTDYVYLPVGGSRLVARLGQNGREGVATMVTMLLCGLWHGAAWTFVAWGGLHGAGMVVNQAWRRARWPMPASLGWALTFMLFATSLVLFRSADFATAARVYEALTGAGGWSFAVDGIRERYIVLTGVALAMVLLCPTSQRIALELARPRLLLAAGLGVTLLAVVLEVRRLEIREFIYFQF